MYSATSLKISFMKNVMALACHWETNLHGAFLSKMGRRGPNKILWSLYNPKWYQIRCCLLFFFFFNVVANLHTCYMWKKTMPNQVRLTKRTSCLRFLLSHLMKVKPYFLIIRSPERKNGYLNFFSVWNLYWLKKILAS